MASLREVIDAKEAVTWHLTRYTGRRWSKVHRWTSRPTENDVLHLSGDDPGKYRIYAWGPGNKSAGSHQFATEEPGEDDGGRTESRSTFDMLTFFFREERQAMESNMSALSRIASDAIKANSELHAKLLDAEIKRVEAESGIEGAIKHLAPFLGPVLATAGKSFIERQADKKRLQESGSAGAAGKGSGS